MCIFCSTKLMLYSSLYNSRNKLMLIITKPYRFAVNFDFICADDDTKIKIRCLQFKKQHVQI